MGKKSFILYDNYYETLKGLSDQAMGKLMRAVFVYAKERKIPKLPSEMQIAFNFIKVDIDRNNESYEKKLELNRQYYKDKKDENCPKTNNDEKTGKVKNRKKPIMKISFMKIRTKKP
jgi:hypothetical protein